jgi:hypothetical protein
VGKGGRSKTTPLHVDAQASTLGSRPVRAGGRSPRAAPGSRLKTGGKAPRSAERYTHEIANSITNEEGCNQFAKPFVSQTGDPNATNQKKPTF